jgi:hypothetical protein
MKKTIEIFEELCKVAQSEIRTTEEGVAFGDMLTSLSIANLTNLICSEDESLDEMENTALEMVNGIRTDMLERILDNVNKFDRIADDCEFIN